MGEKHLNLSLAVSYILTHVLVIGFWGYWRSKYGADAMGKAELDLSGALLITVILAAPPAIVLGLFDAAARIIGHPLLKVLDALLLILLTLIWIVPIELFWLDTETMSATFGNKDVPSRDVYLGVLAGAELSLILLLIVSVSTRLIARSILKRRATGEQ